MNNRLIHYVRAINAESAKEWKIEFKYKPDFIRQFIEPFIYLLPYFLYGIALLGGRYSQNLKDLTGIGDMFAYTFVGYIIMGFLNTAVWAMAWSLRKEQWYGTLDTIFVAPVPRWVYVAGMAFHSTCHQGLIILIQALSISFFFAIALRIYNMFGVLAVTGLMVLSLYGLGIFVSGLTIGLKQWWVISEALSTVITVITPIAYPLAVLPVFIRRISMFLPTTYGVIGIRHLLIGEHLEMSMPTIIIRLAVLLIFWVIAGLIVFSVMDRYGRKKGVASSY